MTNVVDRIKLVAGEDFDSRECRVTNPHITARESIELANHIVALEAQVLAQQLKIKQLEAAINLQTNGDRDHVN